MSKKIFDIYNLNERVLKLFSNIIRRGLDVLQK